MREPFLKGDGVEGVDYDESGFSYVARVPTRRDRWVYRWRCCTNWKYMRQTWLFGHGRLIEWWWNR